MKTPADIAWSRQLSGTSASYLILWTAAGLVMLSAHAGAAWWVMRTPPAPPVMEAGSAAIEVDLAALGFTMADQVSAGEITDRVEPVTSQSLQPITEMAQAKPVETEAVKTPSVPIAPAPATKPSEVSLAALTPVEQPETVKPLEAKEVPLKEVEPVEEFQDLAALERVPVPIPRPEKIRTEKPKTQTARRTPPKSGAGGQNRADSRKGAADGSTKGRAAKQSDRGQRHNTAAGNAAVSNYPGKIASKLRRALRYPRAARRERLKGEAVVSFVVASNGSVRNVRVSRSSGSAILDKAAGEAVRRAAPFPDIPKSANRASWSFSVPLAFTR